MPDNNLDLIQRVILRREALKYFKSVFSHWSTYAAAIGTAITFLTPSINNYIANHPHTSFAILLGAAVAAFHATSPKDSQ